MVLDGIEIIIESVIICVNDKFGGLMGWIVLFFVLVVYLCRCMKCL